jgi:hypothetical protein
LFDTVDIIFRDHSRKGLPKSGLLIKWSLNRILENSRLEGFVFILQVIDIITSFYNKYRKDMPLTIHAYLIQNIANLIPLVVFLTVTKTLK